MQPAAIGRNPTASRPQKDANIVAVIVTACRKERERNLASAEDDFAGVVESVAVKSKQGYEVEAASSPSGVTHLTFTRAV